MQPRRSSSCFNDFCDQDDKAVLTICDLAAMQDAYFVSWTEAQDRVIQHTPVLPKEVVPVEQSGGRILGESVYSPVDMPPFDNSAMDGFAIRWTDPLPNEWAIVGEIPAGTMPSNTVEPGQAMRIFTGAPMPPGADTVIQQEWVARSGDRISLEKGMVLAGAHVRGRATQIACNTLAMEAGELLSPGAIGFLANLGIPAVSVCRRPVVDILVTGSELVKPGQPLGPGQIYESNSHTLVAALAEQGIQPRTVQHVTDDVDAFRHRFNEAIQGSDMVIITGGISVGDHDIVRQLMEEGVVQTHFYKVRQRPGKPLFFGQVGSTLVFALPGNPASVTSCFYQYVYPSLRRMQGFRSTFLKKVHLPLLEGFVKKEGLTFFLKARADETGVLPLSGQLSYIMSSFARANAVIMLEEHRTAYEPGEVVEVHLLDHGRA